MCSLSDFKLKFGHQLSKKQKTLFNQLAEDQNFTGRLSEKKKHQILTICEAKGCQNSLWSKIGSRTLKVWPYCNQQHMPQLLGVQANKSTIPGAGWGLFASRSFKKMSPVVFYGGHESSEVVESTGKKSAKTYRKRKRALNTSNSDYVLELSNEKYGTKITINSELWDNWPSRLINDNLKTLYDKEGYVTKFGSNIAMPTSTIPRHIKPSVVNKYEIHVHPETKLGRRGIWLYASRNIRKGEELFMAYGPDYWE